VLLFGGRLPSVARSMGRSLTEFKKGMQDIERDMSDSINYEPANYEPSSSDQRYDESDEPSTPRFQPPTTPPRDESKSSEPAADAAGS
jgi:sec-independent protein translocase protein TatA